MRRGAPPIPLLAASAFLALSVSASPQEVPAFRFQPTLVEDVAPLPKARLLPWRAQVPELPPPGLARATPRRRATSYVPLALRRQRLRNITSAFEDERFTLRTPDDSFFPAQLSVGFQTELRVSDNINSAPKPLALSDTIFEFKPILQLEAGGEPGLRPEKTLEPAPYLEVFYAPTEHLLLRAGESEFLHHFRAAAGYASPLLHAGLRVSYDENLFGAGADNSPEDSYALLEVEPIVEWRASPRTTLRLRADYRRITNDDPAGNRVERTITPEIDYEWSPKTTFGLGAEFGHVHFDQHASGWQRYQQGYATMQWRATPKITFSTRAGVELRNLQQAMSESFRTTPLVVAVLDWRPSERTRIAASFRVRNQPSVVQGGTLFRETKFALEATQDIGTRFYARIESEYLERKYDRSPHESEMTIRPALGYRLDRGALIDTAKLELYYQFRRHWTNGRDGFDYDRNQGGVQLTVFF